MNPPPHPDQSTTPTDRAGNRFLLLFALANAGAVIAYAPLLTLLLPARVAVFAGPDRIEWLGAATLFGAIAASVGNILFGWASDLIGTRRRWIAAGLILTVASCLVIGTVETEAAIVATVVLWQLCLNMLLAPLFAWAADVVPDHRRGILGGFIAAGQPLGALAGVAATLPILGQDWMRLGVVNAIVVLLIVPLVLRSSVPPMAQPAQASRNSSKLRHDFAFAFAARLLMQVASSVMFAFLLYYFLSRPAPVSQSGVAILSAAALTLAFPLALTAGWISDRLGPRKPFLLGAALFAAFGLGIMALAQTAVLAIVGYTMFNAAAAVFASLHTGFSMQLLPSPHRRGRDMGVLNLANTLPAVVAPALTMLIVPRYGFELLLALLSGLALLAGLCVTLIRFDGERATSTYDVAVQRL